MKSFSRKYGLKYKNILNEDLDDLAKMTKESLRQRLLVLNEEANKRLLQWSKASRENQSFLTIPDYMNRIISRGKIRRYSTKPNQSKNEIIADIQRRAISLKSRNSSVNEVRAERRRRNELLKERIEQYTGVNYDELDDKPSLKKFGRVMKRLREDHYIAGRAGFSGFVLGSANVVREAFSISQERPRENINSLYQRIIDNLDNLRAEQFQQEQELERDLRTTAGFP